MDPEPVDIQPLESAGEQVPAAGQEVTPSVPPPAVITPSVVRNPFWGYDDVAIVLGLLAALTAALLLTSMLFLFVIPGLRQDPGPLLLPLQMAFYGLVWVAFALDFQFRYQKPVFSSLGWRPGGINLLWMAAGGVVLAAALSAFGDLIRTPKVETPFDQLMSTPLSFALLAVTAVILAPIFEELFFRGFLQPLLSRTFGLIAGILITAGLFGALHSFEYARAWQYPLTISLAGVAFGYMRARTNSIIPGAVMHGCFNAVSVIAMGIQKYHKT